MALREETLFGVVDKVEIAIARLRQFEAAALRMHENGYFLAFSGGKDSQCIYHLAKMAGVKFEAHMHLTTVDPPEVLRFVRDHYPDVIRDRPAMSMWRLIEYEKKPPTRIMRYCCEVLKEGHGAGRLVVTGVRWAESAKRTQRQMSERCLKGGGKSYLHPIIDWLDADVWEFLNSNNIPHVCLYDEGFTRVGCIGCPMGSAKQRREQFDRWPGFEKCYRRAFQWAVDARSKADLSATTEWATADVMFDWWMSGKTNKADKNQLSIFDDDGMDAPDSGV